jgi:hypothetical protein
MALVKAMEPSVLITSEDARRELHTVFTRILEDVAPGEAAKLPKLEDAILEFHAQPDLLGNVRKRSFPAEAGFLSLHLVAGTLALIDIIVKRKERLEQREFELNVRREWQKALIEAGMDAALARLIPVKFSADVIRFIVSQRLRSTDDQTSGSSSALS